MHRYLNVLSVALLILGAPSASWPQAVAIVARPETEPHGASVVRTQVNTAAPGIAPGLRSHWLPDTTELSWDDGVPEAYYVVTFPPATNDRMAVRFELPGPPPMRVVGGRFYTDNSVIPLRSFSVCPDAGGYPDVFHPIDQVDTVYGGYPGWGSYELHGAVFDSNDIWAVVHWIPGYVVGIGADSSAPDSNSYWCNQREALVWNQWTATDWMMRLSVAQVADSHDVAAAAILDPPGLFLPGDTADPTAVFGNCGLSSETFDVTFDISDSVGSLIYTSTTTITLASCETETVTFVPEWVESDEGMYTYEAYTSLPGDVDPANDTVHTQGLCTREIVITYCGDYTNTGSGIIGSWASNRKYLVRMTPPVPPPFFIRRAQIFLVEPNAPLEYLCVCPDDGTGLPDTTKILAIGYDVSTPQGLSWTTVDYGELEVTEPYDLWVIAKWPEGITAPHIGFETNSPSSERCWRYYFRGGAGHYENMGLPPYYREWYFRLIIAVPPVGVAEEGASEHPGVPLACTPNPFWNTLRIRFQAPRTEEGRKETTVEIYDLTGRLVRTLLDDQRTANSQQPIAISWDGTDDSSRKLPPGVYFVKLRTPGQSLTRKTILLK